VHLPSGKLTATEPMTGDSSIPLWMDGLKRAVRHVPLELDKIFLRRLASNSVAWSCIDIWSDSFALALHYRCRAFALLWILRISPLVFSLVPRSRKCHILKAGRDQRAKNSSNSSSTRANRISISRLSGRSTSSAEKACFPLHPIATSE